MSKTKRNYNQDYFKLRGGGTQAGDVIRTIERAQYTEAKAREERAETGARTREKAGEKTSGGKSARPVSAEKDTTRKDTTMPKAEQTSVRRKPDGAARLEQSESRRKPDGAARADAPPRPPAGRKDPTRSPGKNRSPREKADDQSVAEGGRVMGQERSARQKSALRTEPRRDANQKQKVANRQTSNKTGVQSGSQKADSARRSPGPESHAAPVGGAFGPGKGEHIAPLRTSRSVDKSPRPKRKAG